MKKPDKEDLIILYCKQGRRAQDGVNSLNEIGFRQAKNYFGGIGTFKIFLKQKKDTKVISNIKIFSVWKLLKKFHDVFFFLYFKRSMAKRRKSLTCLKLSNKLLLIKFVLLSFWFYLIIVKMWQIEDSTVNSASTS